MTWRDDAACRDTDPRRWFLDAREGTGGLTPWHARMCLLTCPVMLQCAADALAHGDHGVIRAGVALHAQTSGRRRLRSLIDSLTQGQ